MEHFIKEIARNHLCTFEKCVTGKLYRKLKEEFGGIGFY